jgi:PIN domain nuclease of toxin-antitoxin system
MSLGIPKRIPPPVMNALEDAATAGGLLVSIISVWELALLVARGKVALPLALPDWIQLAFGRPELRLIGLTRPGIALDSAYLPGKFHGDPADRFLIATARAYRARLATHDAKILEYASAGHLEVLEV